MIIDKKVIRAKFIRRPNRFQAYVELDDEEIMVHVPNTGRCREILLPGTTVLLREENNPLRKTKYDLIAGYKGNNLINIDSHIPNKVVEEALLKRKIDKLSKYDVITKEKTFGSSRFDFKLYNDNMDEYFLEVKGVTLEENSVAMFPDAPTERGAKHLLELVEAKTQGKGAGILFLIQMKGVKVFSPNDIMDKKFSEALRLARKCGVDLFAYDSLVEENSITLDKSISIIL